MLCVTSLKTSGPAIDSSGQMYRTVCRPEGTHSMGIRGPQLQHCET